MSFVQSQADLPCPSFSAGMNGHLQPQDYSRGLNTSQLGSGDLSNYLQQQGLLQPNYNPQMQSNNSLEALLRNTALVQQLQNNAGGLTQSGSSNSLSGQYTEPQLRASASSGNLSMGGNSPPQLSSAHGSRQFMNQAHVGGGLGGVDGQYGLGRRTAGGMSMSTGDLAALYEAAQVTCDPLGRRVSKSCMMCNIELCLLCFIIWFAWMHCFHHIFNVCIFACSFQ